MYPQVRVVWNHGPRLRKIYSDLLAAPLGAGVRYLSSFRYASAGECCMSTDLASLNRIPGDWVLEIGVLAEVYRKLLSQTDLPSRSER